MWALLKSEHATPRQIGCAIGVGVFIGCTPALGLHGAIAIVAATLLRLNRIWTWVGSRVSNVLILPWIVLAEVQLAHWLRTGAFVPLDAHEALKQAHYLLLDWSLGTLPVGGALGLILGLVAYAVARARQRTSAPPREQVSPRTPAAPRRPSSGSPPSARPLPPR